MPPASMPHDNALYTWLRSLQWILSSERPLKVSGPFGTFDVEYHIDLEAETETDRWYAVIGFMLPDDDFMVELEDGTYNVMNGIRIYLDPVQ